MIFNRTAEGIKMLEKTGVFKRFSSLEGICLCHKPR